MRGADAVGEDRDSRTLSVLAPALRVRDMAEPVGDRVRDRRQLRLLAGQKRGRRGVGNRRDAGLEQSLGSRQGVGLPGRGAERHLDRAAQLALVHPAGAPVQVGVAEIVLLHVGDQLLPARLSSVIDGARRAIEVVEPDRAKPCAQQAAGVVGIEVVAHRAATRVALAQQAADHRHHASGVRPFALPVRRVLAERARGQRDRRVRPLGGAALRATGEHVAGADVREEVLRRARGRCFGVGAADVNSGVIVAAADADALACGDIRGRGAVELAGARAVADLPDAEQLGQTAAMPGAQRGLDGVVRVGERAHDLLFVHVGGAQLHVAAVGLQPLVVLAGDAVAKDVHRLGLAVKVRGQLLGDEHVGAVGDLEHARDRVVVCDRHEVHATALGQLVDLLRWRRALGQSDRALHAEL